MKQIISTLHDNTTSSLTTLGKFLFYLYVILCLSGLLGIIFGSIAVILKLTNTSSIAFTPWWEITIFIGISWLIMNIFTKESINMLETNSSERKIIKMKIVNESFADSTQQQSSSNSNVINFAERRKNQDGHI